MMNKDGEALLALSFRSGRGRQRISDRDSPSLVRKARKKWLGVGRGAARGGGVTQENGRKTSQEAVLLSTDQPGGREPTCEELGKPAGWGGRRVRSSSLGTPWSRSRSWKPSVGRSTLVTEVGQASWPRDWVGGAVEASG